MDYTSQHERYLSLAENDGEVNNSDALVPGDIVQCYYHGEKRYILVLNPRHDKLFHGLAMENLPPIAVLRVKPFARQQSALQFYQTYLARQSAFIKYDAYRTFFIDQMSGFEKLNYGVPK